jgi:hypothetical protein
VQNQNRIDGKEAQAIEDIVRQLSLKDSQRALSMITDGYQLNKKTLKESMHKQKLQA